MQKPQDELVEGIDNVINDDGVVDTKTKEKLAQVVREHYKKHKATCLILVMHLELRTRHMRHYYFHILDFLHKNGRNLFFQ